EHVSARANHDGRHQPHGDDQHADDPVLETMSHREMRSRSHERKPSAGSTPMVSGTDAIGRSPRLQAASRTASFSVVNTIADPLATASDRIRSTSRAVNR